MVGQHPQFVPTAQSLELLRNVEQKVLTFLTHATEAVRALSATESAQTSTAVAHSQQFLTNLFEVQAILRAQIQTLISDIPMENVTMRRLIEADLSLQRTAHIHRSLVHILKLCDEPISGISGAPTTAPSPPYMPSPVASTPMGIIGATLPTINIPSTITGPSPDATPGNTLMTVQRGLNGGAPENAEAHNADAPETNKSTFITLV